MLQSYFYIIAERYKNSIADHHNPLVAVLPKCGNKRLKTATII